MRARGASVGSRPCGFVHVRGESEVSRPCSLVRVRGKCVVSQQGHVVSQQGGSSTILHQSSGGLHEVEW